MRETEKHRESERGREKETETDIQTERKTERERPGVALGTNSWFAKSTVNVLRKSENLTK